MRGILSFLFLALLSFSPALAAPVNSGDYVAVTVSFNGVPHWWWLAPEQDGNGTQLYLRNTTKQALAQGTPVSNNSTFFIERVNGDGVLRSGDYVRLRGINSDYFGADPWLMEEGHGSTRVRVANPNPQNPKDPTVFFIDGLGASVISYGAPFIIRGTAAGDNWLVAHDPYSEQHITLTQDRSEATRFAFLSANGEARIDNHNLRPESDGGCPSGSSRNSFGWCIPNCGGDICGALERIADEVRAQFLGNPLAVWLQASRDSAVGQAKPIPGNIRQQLLAKGVDPAMIDLARWKVDDNGFFNLGGLTVKYGDRLPNNDPQAITLIDVVVFSPGADLSDVGLWAHELWHVKQYNEWGVRDFAIRYSRNPDGVEEPAYAEEARF
jgi:hypothetical protein